MNFWKSLRVALSEPTHAEALAQDFETASEAFAALFSLEKTLIGLEAAASPAVKRLIGRALQKSFAIRKKLGAIMVQLSDQKGALLPGD